MNIELWYDVYTSSWVIQLKDDHENQIGEAEYHGQKKFALQSIETDFKKQYPEATIKVFKRDGELQKTI